MSVFSRTRISQKSELMANNYRPLLCRAAGTPSLNTTEERSGKKQRIQTKNACETCRRRKCGCDGSRPKCSGCNTRGAECVYLTQNENETRIMALKRERDELQRTLSSQMAIINYLQNAPEAEALEALRLLRTTIDSPGLTNFSLNNKADAYSALPQLGDPQGMFPETPLECELSLLHPIAYPVLLPTQLPPEFLALVNADDAGG
ncbi:hypothetical protein NA57DRAFT_58388 [Rhizodiscina lignyota]|uniref:Zn(2)-C6 fungal-type domain-containing protein n=1 Tax=Rhizodiscina lignyota TaxID=1504668 RepID=A0A9P4M856_9PEZI|nr:hypothetical protein NA57DRAFT_58388 [Rhizodiscina lignyota]